MCEGGKGCAKVVKVVRRWLDVVPKVVKVVLKVVDVVLKVVGRCARGGGC